MGLTCLKINSLRIDLKFLKVVIGENTVMSMLRPLRVQNLSQSFLSFCWLPNPLVDEAF